MGQSFQGHIQQLFQAGVATHTVSNAVALDPLFALSKVQDFPEVTFAAAFPDGTVVLGCQAGVPQPLDGLAQPIVALETPIANALEDKLDGVIRQLHDQAKQRDINIADRLTEVEQTVLSHQNDLLSAIKDQDPTNALQKQLALLIANTQSSPELDAVAAALRGLQDAFEERFETRAPPVAPITAETIETQILALEGRLVAQWAATSDANGEEAQSDAIDALQQTVEQSLTTLSNDVKTLITLQGAASAHPDPEVLHAETRAQLANLDVFSDLSVKLEALTAIAKDTQSTTTSRAEISQLMALLDAIAAQVSDIAKMPPPVLDLTEQRQSLSRFQTAMAAVLSRLDTAITEVGSVHQNAPAAQLQIDTIAEDLAKLVAVPDQITQLGQAVDAAAQQDAHMIAQLETLSATTDPMVRDATQRRSFAHFSEMIGAVATRIEAAASAMHTPKDESAMTAILEKLDATLSAIPDRDTPPDVGRITDALRDELNVLRTDFAAYFERPAPILDLTAQRTSFAQFATTLGTIISRFENVAATLEQTQISQTAPPLSATSAPEADQKPTMFPAAGLSWDTLKSEFAEMIAKQIMQQSKNTGHTSPPD